MSTKFNFPLVVRSGSATVKVYRIRPGRPNEHYEVRFYSEGAMHRHYFSDLDKAKAEAKLAAEKLAAGELEVLKLVGQDRQEYLAAKANLQPTGIPIMLATKEYADMCRMLNGVSPLEAIRFYLEHRKAQFTPKKVLDVVEELIALKEARRKSAKYLKDLGRLRRFANDETFREAFIHEVRGEQVEKWLASLNREPRTINNYLKLIRTLFRFAKKRNYLTQDHPGASDVEPAEEDSGDIEIFTPQEVAKLLEVSKPCMRPYLALGAFAGIRSAELERLDWGDVKFDRNVIEIKPKKSKTRSRRLAPMTENLRAWLQPHCRPEGPIAPFANMWKQLMWLSEAAGIPWKHNGLRHSFVSYRLAQTRNENEVALEAGNSPRMIFQHYRELVTQEDAKRYFGIMPASEANVIPMAQAAAS